MEAGPHGHGFFRPFVGADVALHVYTIGTTLVVPDDNNPGGSLTQNLPGGDNKLAFGYDVAVGIDLQYRRFFIESGVRFLKSFNVPQQFGRADARQIHPGYFQVFLGFGRTIW